MGLIIEEIQPNGASQRLMIEVPLLATKEYITLNYMQPEDLQQQEEKYIPVGEHKFYLPPQPPKEEILFHNLPKKEQYWRRDYILKEMPLFFTSWHRDVIEDAKGTVYDGKTLVSLSREDTTTLITLRDREIRRIKDGIWFYNNGIPTYLTGGHYGVLMWGAMADSLNQVEEKSIYGSYMRFQRNYCYFIEICKVTPHASGGNVVKPKKTGITMLQSLLLLMDAITHRSAWYRMMSTTQDVAKKINFRYIAYALEKLPPILTPEYSRNLGAVHFENSDVSQRRSSKRRSDTEFLDSHIETVATVANAFDSGKNRCAWIDEESKIEIDKSNNVTTLHNITLPTVSQGFMRIGYVIYTHYVSEKNNDSFRRAKTIFYDSFLKTIDPGTKRTRSGLLAYAMFVQDGTFGACDKYGEPEVDKIWPVINAEVNARKNDAASLRSYKRQYPTCLDDMWQEGAGEASVFDNMRLGVQLHKITEEESFGHYPYMDFNFKWVAQPEIDEIKGVYKFPLPPIVVPVTDQDKRDQKPHGVFKWYMPHWTPKHFLDKALYKPIRDRKGKLIPNPQCPFYAAVDPTQYSQKKDVVTGSKNAIQVFVLPNAELDAFFNEKVTNKRLMVEYLHRPDSPRDTLMHVVQMIMYFGCYVLIECNANWLATRLKEWGFGNFLIVMNKDTGILEPYKEYATDQKPFTSQKSENGGADTIGDYVAAGMNHLAEDINGVDNIPYIHSTEVITQLMNFDPMNTTQYDAGVCYLIGLLGINTFMGWRQRQTDKQNRGGNQAIRDFARGMMS
jgi:hypothetical protein